MADQFPTTDIIRLLVRRSWLIGIITIVAAAAGYFYSLSLPIYYKSTVNCVPARTDQNTLGGGLGGLGSTLKDIGLTKLGGKQGESYEFAVILFTKSIRDSMIKRFELVKEYNLEGKPRGDLLDEFENNVEVNLHAEGNYEITIWSKDAEKAVKMCSTFVDFTNQVANRMARLDAEQTTTYLEKRVQHMDSAMNAVSDSLSTFSKTYLMFSPVDQAQAAAGAMSDLKATLLQQETVLGLLQSSYGADDPQVKSQQALVNQLQVQYGDLLSKPGFAGNFPITDAAGIGARFLKFSAEFEAFAKLKAFLMPTLEQAQLDQRKNTPSLLIVDQPEIADRKDRPKRAMITAGAGVGAGILTIIILLAFRAWRSVSVQERKAA